MHCSLRERNGVFSHLSLFYLQSKLSRGNCLFLSYLPRMGAFRLRSWERETPNAVHRGRWAVSSGFLHSPSHWWSQGHLCKLLLNKQKTGAEHRGAASSLRGSDSPVTHWLEVETYCWETSTVLQIAFFCITDISKHSDKLERCLEYPGAVTTRTPSCPELLSHHLSLAGELLETFPVPCHLHTMYVYYVSFCVSL